MANANDIINGAYGKIGLNNPNLSDSNSALTMLNNMISSWGLEYLVEAVTSESFPLTIGKSSYTIGSGGDFDTVRPIRVVSFFIRDSDNLDRIMRLISPDDYDRIYDKAYEAKPYWFFYLNEYPLGKIILGREADMAYTAYFRFSKNFIEFDSLISLVNLPPFYKEALIYNLAICLAEDRDVQLAQTVYVKAENAKNMIDVQNSSLKLPPVSRFNTGSKHYDIFTNEYK